MRYRGVLGYDLYGGLPSIANGQGHSVSCSRAGARCASDSDGRDESTSNGRSASLTPTS
jgi:hypothetical protein